MPFFDLTEAEILKGKMTSDASTLGKIFKAKSLKFHRRNVDHNRLEDFLSNGWEEYGTPLKTKTKIQKPKSHDEQFEDDLWCQLYKLGFRNLNIDRKYSLPFGSSPNDRKQIDIVAANDETILLIECKSSESPRKAPSFKTEFEALRQRLDGHRKALEQLFGRGKKVKFIFATRNLRLSRDSADIQRLEDAGGFYYNHNTFDYVESLIRHYKDAAKYQFLGMLFKGQNINDTKIAVPAIEGKMGNKTYYMFSLEPEILLKIGYVLHRTRANEAEMQTYQRLLVPSRLKGIGKFINGGGYFPNSIIINFNESKRQKIQFEASSRSTDSASRAGVLKIPNAHAVAYIIDGQHRVYGYSQSNFIGTNTIPVVAFSGLESGEQLEMFMDINQNQKAVSPTLRITLEEDLYWESGRLDSRLKALRSSIISSLGGDPESPLFGKVSLGEDKAVLQAKPFSDALLRCGLIPEAKGNKFTIQGENRSLYDVLNEDHKNEMQAAKKRILALLYACYESAEEHLGATGSVIEKFIVANRGTYAFISLIGSLITYEATRSGSPLSCSDDERFERIEKYLGKLGTGAETSWLRNFQNEINIKFNDYAPVELDDWKERQNQELQERGRIAGTEIERHLKRTILSNLAILFPEVWELEIASIKRKCEERASEQMERNYREGFGKTEIEWTEQFTLSDYKTIIEKYWVKKPDQDLGIFHSFEDHYAIDTGQGFNSKAEKLKWFSRFNSLRNTWAHEGSKDKGLNREEVEFLEHILGALL